MSDSVPQKQRKKVSDKKAQKIAGLASEVALQSIDDSNLLAFQAQVFTQASLPYRDPKTYGWARSNGNYSLILESGSRWDKKNKVIEKVGLPFGSYPRLFLIWLTTEVLRVKKDTIHLGNSLKAFMDELGIDGRSGASRKRFLEQLDRLLRTRFTFEYSDEKRISVVHQNFASKFNLWKNQADPEQLELMSSSVQLDPHIFEQITKSAIPLDLRAVRTFQQSAFTLDLYAWLTYRILRQVKSRKAQKIGWESLRLQFGSQAKHLRNFRQEFRNAFTLLVTVFPRFQVAVRLHEDGLLIHPEDPFSLTKIQKKLFDS